MMVVENISGMPRIISKVKRKVRLASGLDTDNKLSLEAMTRGWECLAWFGEHLSSIPISQVRVVATATLRLASNAQEFCDKGNVLLGCNINIISGDQEAALIYHGMAVTSNGGGNRLIIDIGGASTELILGSGLSPMVLNSLNMGCVTWLERYFADGKLSQANFDLAIIESQKILAPVKQDYVAHHWQLTLGASGSVQAVQEVLVAQGLNEHVTLDKLEHLMAQCIACKDQEALVLEGLANERRVVFVSGLSILIMLFRELPISSMLASGGALREGVINQLINEPIADNICRQTCLAVQHQFQLDVEQARQVTSVARRFAGELDIEPSLVDFLDYSAMLHELGVSVEYINAPQHAQYLLNHLPLSGFSLQQRHLLIALIGNYKGDINEALLRQQGSCDEHAAKRLLSCLRLAVICVGRHQIQRCDAIVLKNVRDSIHISVDKSLMSSSPLLMTHLLQEAQSNSDLLL